MSIKSLHKDTNTRAIYPSYSYQQRPSYFHFKADCIAILASPPSQPLHPAPIPASTMCHSSHVMRHSGHRHLYPPQHATGTSGAGSYIHACLLFCWFLASVHWAWVWYVKRRDARREQSEARSYFPPGETLLREGRWEDGGDQGDFSLWPGDASRSEFFPAASPSVPIC